MAAEAVKEVKVAVVATAEVEGVKVGSVVVVIVSDIFKVVVLSAGPDAFLGIDRAVIITASGSKEDVLELGHPGIGEE